MSAAWLAEAVRLPLAFAQVREDPRIDLALLGGPGSRVLMVASGGCTVARLAADPRVALIHAVDPNPAQLALARLKLALLPSSSAERRQLLGRLPMAIAARQHALADHLEALGLTADALGPPEVIATLGPDRAGRYEACFQALAQRLCRLCDPLLEAQDPLHQCALAAPDTMLGHAIDMAFDEVLALPNLVALFGDGATRNPVQPFVRHFAARLRACLAAGPARGNHFLSQMLADRDPPGGGADWLQLPPTSAAPVTWQRATMDEALTGAGGGWQLIHLSNILDWLDPVSAMRTLDLATRALAPDGRFVIRQLNSTIDIPALAPGLAWDDELATRLHAGDRSFFYSRLHVGGRR